MEIASHLWKSRHGVYYFRETSLVKGKQVSRKISLLTKDPREAKKIAIQILATMAREEKVTRKFEVQISPTGIILKTDPNDPTDAEKLGKFLRQNKDILESIAPIAPFTPSTPPVPVEDLTSGTNFTLVVEKYEKRKAAQLAPKSLYGYLQYIGIFHDWIKKQEGKSVILINSITKKTIAKYIEHLQNNGINNVTIEKNYLRSLNSLLEFAKSTGDFPDITVPSKGHKLTTKKEIEKNAMERNPFTDNELKTIFLPENILDTRHPEEFWLPLLALFTGGRLSELAQLTQDDVVIINNIPSLAITDENGGRVKTSASKRLIPIHPIIIQTGFLDYVEDMKKFGKQIFPDLKPDAFGYFGKEPSRRWAVYLDKVGITDKSKVFHSFRSTANDRLKQNGISEEERCEYVGHDHGTVNSKHYSKKYTVSYMLANIIPKLDFVVIDTNALKYKQGKYDAFLYKELARIKKNLAHKEVRSQKIGKK